MIRKYSQFLTCFCGEGCLMQAVSEYLNVIPQIISSQNRLGELNLSSRTPPPPDHPRLVFSKLNENRFLAVPTWRNILFCLETSRLQNFWFVSFFFSFLFLPWNCISDFVLYMGGNGNSAQQAIKHFRFIWKFLHPVIYLFIFFPATCLPRIICHSSCGPL